MDQKKNFSQFTLQKVQAAKLFIERRYAKLIQEQRQKKLNWDLLYKKMHSLNMPIKEQEIIKNNIIKKESQKLRNKRKKVDISFFTPVKIIGRGAFGQVRLCKENQTGQPLAIKKLKKRQMIFKNKGLQAKQQKQCLAYAQNCPWIVELKYSFQDDKNLYLAMEYLPGGDLMNLLIKKNVLSQQQSRFYAAQTLLALQFIHKLKYIHRDIKPDNILLDQNGHVKLSDFGLCKYTDFRTGDRSTLKDDRYFEKYTLTKNIRRNYSAVGTPDYVAPQVQQKNGYTETVDYWSLGIILFEMLVGYPPFMSQENTKPSTWQKIQNWRKYLVIPKEAKLSHNSIDIIRRLINDPKQRLGVNGIQEIKQHPFFALADWKNIRKKKAPNIPLIKNSFDTENFDEFPEEQPWVVQRPTQKNGKNALFIGYTYKKNTDNESQLLKALVDLQNRTDTEQSIKHKNTLQSMDLHYELNHPMPTSKKSNVQQSIPFRYEQKKGFEYDVRKSPIAMIGKKDQKARMMGMGMMKQKGQLKTQGKGMLRQQKKR